MDTETCTITKTLIAEPERLDALPRYLGKHFLEFEMGVYGYMDHFCEAYNGGYWDYYRLSNGGFFMCLSGDEHFKVFNEGNHFADEMSSEAVSIGVNLFALNALLWGDHVGVKIRDLYDNLQLYAADFPDEAGKIWSFID